MANLKVYEAKSLRESMEDRSNEYARLREQLQSLKKQFTQIVQLDENLQGKGAIAIKGFYQAQIDVIVALLRLVDMQVAFFNGISGNMEDLKLSGSTKVDETFLEHDLTVHENNHFNMVENQQEDLKTILNRIDDLVSIQAFSTDSFESKLEEARKRRKDTLEAVDTLDQQLLEEYKLSEHAELHATALFRQLIEATKQGNTISPINFNATAYKASEAYQLNQEMADYTDDYLSFKAEQERYREELKKAEELENRPAYKKMWDSMKTFTGELTGYHDFIRATEGVDPVTGEKLSESQRVMAGAMAAAGFIPIVGWGGRAFKGGSVIVKTAKGMNATDQALSLYKTPKTFQYLEKAELGIYGLASANGMSEYITGKDMFGHDLTEIERQQSLYTGVLGSVMFASPLLPTFIKNGKLVKEETRNKLGELTTKTKAGTHYVFNEVAGGMNVLLRNQGMEVAYSASHVVPRVMSTKEVSKRVEEAGVVFAVKGTGKYQVGAYKDIKGVEGLDAHHAGQKAAMKKLVDNYDLNTAPAINVPKVGHTIKGPNGIVSRSTKGIDNPRQLLARDIRELRRVYDDIPNSALKELIELNKKMYPEMRK
ncbi:ribonuclease YeeF family protein [Bacillus weihaiensis]|uniref:LXG domain-containing protein n=1 Tax=Bacillus weihaiensis TaxID=1547283 RepID=A0A1L3MRH6_9BACI|nr:T7SS effector LXG polymorphic toxin [Bacillus weihaiensis]APH04959.1 hypothetical protein A9C19_09465 [Bacillus weihaiensis]